MSLKSKMRKFDINVKKLAASWETYHALREIIANALDEQALTQTKDIDMFEDSGGNWHIRDYGRGIRSEHFTQSENGEKLVNPNLIGKFGLGLKDALVTFCHKGIKVIISSRFGIFTFSQSPQHEFDDIVTLQMYVYPAKDTLFAGTEFIFSGLTKTDIEQAKNLFLKFSGNTVLENNSAGQVLEKNASNAIIYVNGLRVAEEENFLFSYNITSLDSKIRRALNRERININRAAYSDRIKLLLKSCHDQKIGQLLIADMSNHSHGTQHDELKWLDIQEHAAKFLNVLAKVIFLTSEDLLKSSDLVDQAKKDGYELITISPALMHRIRNTTDMAGKPLRDIRQIYNEYPTEYEFKFISPGQLSPQETTIYESTDKILALIGGKPAEVQQIRIAETLQKKSGSDQETTSLWNASTGTMIIKRSQLNKLEDYAATLLHELSHVKSGAPDVTRDFEIELTRLLGQVMTQLLINHQPLESHRFWKKLF
ncbi:hypothetical protein P22_2319 [Propionispora sp. 2/2-37]|uniref:ATP-binding protein n=1 Tax=Propionispora sp. 2/2-37 TaxID=1677858 RepID=UPI0006C4EA08|nr:ATP-binding protein [Propionispora sp. 2/2-37]CUH96230.1 hypothetical protein P22_2319 [Propionispora sp. 2/2-37]